MPTKSGAHFACAQAWCKKGICFCSIVAACYKFDKVLLNVFGSHQEYESSREREAAPQVLLGKLCQNSMEEMHMGFNEMVLAKLAQ